MASKILSQALLDAGFDVKMSEVHGMAQRGGSVTTQIRYGDKVYSPIIGKGEADIVVSFEKMEAIRWIEYLKKGGKIVVNDYEIPSAPILMGNVAYPDGILEELQEKADAIVLDATNIARELGNIKTMNVVLLGALVKAMGLEDLNWDKAIKENVKENLVDINVIAFTKGLSYIQ